MEMIAELAPNLWLSGPDNVAAYILVALTYLEQAGKHALPCREISRASLYSAILSVVKATLPLAVR
jgi:hypothetical protein